MIERPEDSLLDCRNENGRFVKIILHEMCSKIIGVATTHFQIFVFILEPIVCVLALKISQYRWVAF